MAQDRLIDANGNLDSLIARHAAANNVPEDLVRRIIKRESRGNARAISKGNYGLMQIRLGTARAMGYRGTAAGLLDADTNMTYAVKYLAGAYHVADGNANRAVSY
ncbi:MAG TPA: lytic transglycosylase domain-containing protein, partial [Pseudolabrys sp.]|nr:lytic transglycosylase domain-containing protein [Pseudolabrys sp.]